MNTDDIKYALQRKYKDHLLVFEAGNDLGFNKTRRADCLMFSTSPHKKLTITGLEFKTDRGDWRNELSTPEKSYEFFQYCDYWMLVVTSLDIVKDDVLPDNWGLMLLDSDGTLRVVKDPVKLDPKPFPRSFIFSVIKRALQLGQSLVFSDEYVKAIYAQAEATVKQDYEKAIKLVQAETQKMNDTCALFKSLTGIPFEQATVSRIASLVNSSSVLSRDPVKTLQQLEETLTNLLSTVREDICVLLEADNR